MRITVEVKTNSREESVEDLGEGLYLVKIREPPHKGKANQAVLKILHKHFRKQVRLVSGATSTIKIFELLE